MTFHRLWVASIALVISLPGSVSSRPALAGEWRVYPTHCSLSSDSQRVVVPCGDFGKVVFGPAISPPPNCPLIAQGNEPGEHDLYAPPATRNSTFPGQFTPAPPKSGPAGKVAIIDFSGAHGRSVRWLAGAIAGDVNDTSLFELDGPERQFLGRKVSDSHVLATTCALAEKIRAAGPRVPATINLSFGRYAQPFDATSAQCSSSRTSCQIAKLLDHLTQRGSLVVAAGGNHGLTLFPAVIDVVAKSGMLDVFQLIKTDGVAPARETATKQTALMAGNALCIAHWPAAPGSSYSSATFAGWVAGLNAGADTGQSLTYQQWWPERKQADSCWQLVGSGGTRYGCNDQVDAIFVGLSGGYENDCWRSPTITQVELVHATPTHTPVDPTTPSFDAWTAQQMNPTPATDPCVPCIGGNVGTSFHINMSQSGRNQIGVLQSVTLQSGNNNFLLPLNPQQMNAINTGTIGTLVLVGWAGLVPPVPQPSLRFVYTTTTGSSYWTSAPILMQ